MSEKDLLRLAALSREQLLKKLHELEDARRVVVALIRARPKVRRKAVRRAP
jgi:hypothetical protein